MGGSNNHNLARAFPDQEIEGVVERITFQNEENGYTIARLKLESGRGEEITLVGTLSGVNVGEAIRVKGAWVAHPQYGRQFEIHQFTIQLPATLAGMEKYLGSGLIKGVGPVTAGKIIAAFGLDSLDVIETTPHRLMEVPGIGQRKVEIIAAAWEAQKQIKEIMLFLQTHGVSPTLAVKIYKAYGDNSIEVVRNDPYRLAKDIYGIGFRTADKIALQIGLPHDSPYRIRAGLVYSLSSLSEDGHCYAEQEAWMAESAQLLELAKNLCQPEVVELVLQGEVIQEDSAYYLPPFFYAENGSAKKIARLITASSDRLAAFQKVTWPDAFSWLDENTPIQLSPLQKEAIQMALTNKVSILTGGPGTGKSTITASVIKLLKTRGASILLAAPTGRAAKRLTEATGLPAKTIHRLLEFSPTAISGFQRDQKNPLDADMIVIDETSMVDILLANHLLAAIGAGSHVLFVGDADQLPSVGPGNFLRDLIQSQVIPVTRLDVIYRQAEDSYIIFNAHRINQGLLPTFSKESIDFFIFQEDDPEKAANRVVELASQRITDRFGFSAERDIQVLSPLHRGTTGVTELNERLQNALNPPAPGKVEFHHGSRVFRIGDRVMQLRNDYERQVFNGDMGVIQSIDLEEQILLVEIDGRPIQYDWATLDELIHAYAISIHKSQGSEYPVVIIPMLTQHYRMLQRNLLYTAVTRARKLVVLVGTRQAVQMAVKNNHIAIRNTRLKERLVTCLTELRDPSADDAHLYRVQKDSRDSASLF